MLLLPHLPALLLVALQPLRLHCHLLLLRPAAAVWVWCVGLH
jgi:hypothetical protein